MRAQDSVAEPGSHCQAAVACARAAHDEKQLAAIVIYTGAINAANRFNVATRQVAGKFG